MSNELYIKKLTSFAFLYRVSEKDAHVLPALFEYAAEKVNMNKFLFVDEALKNASLGKYMAEKAEHVAYLDRNALN